MQQLSNDEVDLKEIPTISLAQYLDGTLSDGDFSELARACEDHGFFLLSQHGQEAVVEAVFAQSEAFFAQDKDCKTAIMRDEVNPLGYYDRELTKQKRDLKEVFDFKAGGYISKNPAKQTRWPVQPEGFQATLTQYFEAFTRLSEQTMEMVFTSLGMPPAEIRQIMAQGFGSDHSSTARLNYYPAQDPVPAAERAGLTSLGDMALHHHTDPGAITLLLQDSHGGLQARSKQHGWIDVPPVSGTIVVNIGDVLQVWTNDRCTAGAHRVLPVSAGRGRYSTPYFYSPRYNAEISPWVAPGEQPHYHSFSWREFIRGRVTDNFADYGASDIQIDRYRINAA